MKTSNWLQQIFGTVVLLIVAAFMSGCATTQEGHSTKEPTGPAVPGKARRFVADDGRKIDIGPASSVNGGLSYKNPHLEKCWIAEGFDFSGYDVLYIAPTQSTAKYQPDEQRLHEWAKETLPQELAKSIKAKGIFRNVATSESEIKAGAKVLKLENTITEYAKGGGAARYWVGLYGGGQPVLRVRGNATDGGKEMFTFEARRSGTSAGSRMGGVFMKDEDIQIEDIRSMVLDLTDFVAAVAGKYTARK